jgi:hypothetical protein
MGSGALAMLAAVAMGGVYDLSDPEFLEQARADLKALRRNEAGLDLIATELAAHPGLLRQSETTPATPEEKQRLLTAWAAFYEYATATEALRQRYWDFLKVPRRRALKHGVGYLITHAALTVELSHGLSFVDRAGGNKQLEVLLDEPAPELGIPRGAFARLKERVVHVATSTQLLTGDEYGKNLGTLLDHARQVGEKELGWLLALTRMHSTRARELLARRGAQVFLKTALDWTKDAAARAIFPVQKGVAEWMGDTRVHRAGKPLVRAEQVKALLPRMQPGDIVVARQNWFLSNIGLPGFWPHAELYTGTAADLAAFFDGDPEVASFVRAQPEGVETFTALLAARFPEKWRAFQGKSADGGEIRIIESISEGVSFTSTRHGMEVDYVGVLRPRLAKVEKARAVLRAFGYQGRPYDFDFDFFSDSQLVCTELVYKAYAPSSEGKGLKIDLVNVAGRMTLPANELVRLYDREAGREDRQLDFVAFLDGREAIGRAVEGDEASFRKTYQRIKWDVAQK